MVAISEQRCGKTRRRGEQRHMELEIRKRRNRLLGLWAAQRLNLGSAAAIAYAGQIASDTIANATNDGIVSRLADDLAVAGVPADLEVLREELQRLGNVAALEVRKAVSRQARAA